MVDTGVDSHERISRPRTTRPHTGLLDAYFSARWGDDDNDDDNDNDDYGYDDYDDDDDDVYRL